jgi:putative transposase
MNIAWWHRFPARTAVHGLADPQERRDQPGAAPGWAGWPEFLRSRAQGILALDFFTAGLLNGTKFYVLAAIEHGTRRVRFLGATEHPVQQARNLLMDLEDAGPSTRREICLAALEG